MQQNETSRRDRLIALENKLVRKLKTVQHRLEQQQTELDESQRHVFYRQVADSLMASRDLITKGNSRIIIENVHTGELREINVNPRFDTGANAELYYKKARKSQRGEEICKMKVAESQTEITSLNHILSEIKGLLSSPADEPIDTIIDNWESLVENRQNGPGQQKELVTRGEEVPYRHFFIDGWHVYAGKNDEQNDEISTRFAHPSDIWLHVAGHAGSHIIIRRPKASPPPPREVIEKTSSLALWFSKARHTSYAEVHVTEARFVRKRRHSPPGEVIAERCKTVRISPKSPHDLFPSMYAQEDNE
jgi:predicted ribosome quality control (RQC) complex YloA/Tae2 family protein